MAPKGIAPFSLHSLTSSEESPRSVVHEYAEGIPLEDKKINQHADSEGCPGFDDEFFVLVRKGSNGLALYSVLAISVIISLVSFILMYQYQPPLEQEGENDVNLWGDICTSPQRNTVWVDLLTEQIEILQNLIHASLLGGAALVAAYRGDVVWLFFVRNCLFYFGLAATSFLLVDTISGVAPSWRLVFAILFCFFGLIGFVKLEATCWSLRRLNLRLFEMTMTPPSSLKESADRDNLILPNYQAQTIFQQSRANLIFQGAVLVQIVAAVYVACTTLFAFIPASCDTAGTNPHRHVEGVVPDHQGMSATSLSSFQMGYSLGAHEAFLLALFMLASTFPRCPASVGGALMTSVWRLSIACCSLISLSLTHETTNARTYMSLLFTLLEAASMIPIAFASWQLTVEAGTFETILGRAAGGTSSNKFAAAYEPVAASDFDDEIETGCSSTDVLHEDDATVQRISVPTLGLIARSSRFSRRQRFGAGTLRISSFCLLVGMTVENMVLLITSPVGAHSTHEIYKWGMHLCAMFAFCVIMNVSSSVVYAHTRRLLCFACPTGSFVALWQLWVLVTSTPDLSNDPIGILVACLFVWRAASGIGQCLGLLALDSIEPEEGSLEQMDITTNDAALNDDTMLRNAILQGRFALFRLFLPAFVVYTATSALLSNCSEPMISPTVPLACEGMNMFMLVPNWPGLGLFFHFGGLLTIFASDGLTTSTPSYPPSITIGALFALHSSLLIATHLIMELMHTDLGNYLDTFGWKDWARRITLVGWMATSFYLYICLNRVWKLKQPVDY